MRACSRLLFRHGTQATTRSFLGGQTRALLLSRVCTARAQFTPTVNKYGRRYISLKSLFASPPPADGASTGKQKLYVQPDDLFHALSKSPIKEMREKGALIEQHGCCPTCVDETTAAGKAATREPRFECPDCGYPTHCSKEHWEADRAHHAELCKHLREANEDEHDLRSGRTLREFEFPSAQLAEIVVNLSSWDTFLYTRSFTNISSDRAMRHVTKVLTYPVTIGAVLHAYSPFTLKSGLTYEGLKSMTALRTTMKEHELARSEKELALDMPPLRIFVLGARAEAMLPPHLYLQLSYLLPYSPIHVYFVGPECIPNADETRSTIAVSSKLSLKYHKGYFHDLIWNFAPFDPFTDVFFMFSPGVAHPKGRPAWHPTIEKLLETKCAVYATGFHEKDMAGDVAALEEDFGKEMDWLLKPQQNPFGSLKRDFGIRNLNEWAIANWGIYGFRGKRYEVQSKKSE